MHLEVAWSLNFPLHVAVILLLSFSNPNPHSLLGSTVFLGNANQSNDTDRQALLQFKAKIIGDQLGILHSWNNSVHYCQWHGVTCGPGHQRVTKLELISLKLMGSISPFIGNLSFLEVLNLRNNGFSQELPQEIGRLGRLRELVLHTNSIGGEIPSNISGCSKLTRLHIPHNKLVGEIPAALGHLLNLKELGLSNNSLTGSIPSSLGNLSSLEIIYLPLNRLTGAIPESLGQLTKLTLFAAGANELSGIVPPSIFNLSRIKTLDVGSNQFHGSLPSDLGITMPYLETFRAGLNRLSGPFPLSVSNNSNLINVELSFNNLTGNLPSFDKLNKLQWFTITDNLLGSGGKDDMNSLCTFTNATSLLALEMNANNFGGVFPECVGNLSTNLTFLLLDNNNISGSIPVGIGNLISLEMLYAWRNQLSGPIPSVIGNLQKLQQLDLGINSISGVIPNSLGNLKMLNELRLNDNNLHGTIPLSLGKCEYLVGLDLSNNNLSGNIPPEVAGLSSLSIYLDLSSNHLTGVLPIEVGNLKNLGQFSVYHNQLSGVLPSSLSSCLKLEKLLMSDNYFQGSFPSSFSSLRGLAVVDISHNNFSGMVPTDGVFKNANATSLQGNNKLCGGTPEFHLPRCNLKSAKSRSSKLTIAIISGLLGLGVTLVFSVLLVFRYKKIRSQPTSTWTENSLLKLSYQSILKATDGFSSANLVGAGSFGSVYKGILEENGIVIAIKVLNLLSPGSSRSFMAECEALRSIRHRNLVKVLTACSGVDYHGNDFKALVYQFMVNGSLEDWLHPSFNVNEVKESQKKLNFYQRMNVAIDVACALDYLHHHCETPIVHCDLKPSNILLDDEMIGHVGDFGLAKFISANMQDYSTSQSITLGLRGTIGYAPPEYGLGSEVSTVGDVYSYGILLLEMFTGKRPTDDMFKEGLNLHNFVKAALPEQIVEIIDPILLQERVAGDTTSNHTCSASSQRDHNILDQCLNSIFEIGVTCSDEFPTKRMNMSDVSSKLCFIRNKLFPTQLRQRRPTRNTVQSPGA
ncbi:probable LRR receptor-like serine/threonine-protein kinase At3g47570 [Durio zibethinus]|uniref:non-specific serine/threonine protein kinase n=1 Tax=Durio zibethinus TaxID=66656 RepID=A0A6P5YWH5_DURZI|nr:probable LRR receptor-like serine/threonine-protein kinase At3g47570 [Durio zibethinus]